VQQSLGCARRKPGKGEATLSMSCSDKMAKWVLLGVQGCLLSYFLQEPIFMDTVTILVDSNRREEEEEEFLNAAKSAAFRALVGRTRQAKEKLSEVDWICQTEPRILLVPCSSLSKNKFGHTLQPFVSSSGSEESSEKRSKAGVSINWSALHYSHHEREEQDGKYQPIQEVTQSGNGKKAGANKKKKKKRQRLGGEDDNAVAAGGGGGGGSQETFFNLKVISTISRHCTFERIHHFIQSHTSSSGNAGSRVFELLSPPKYLEFKRSLGTRYLENWHKMMQDKDSIFHHWIPKIKEELP
jgi:hypothetical protein